MVFITATAGGYIIGVIAPAEGGSIVLIATISHTVGVGLALIEAGGVTAKIGWDLLKDGWNEEEKDDPCQEEE